jgi:hypothetical protein
MGALGFEPRSAGFFHAGSYPARFLNYGSALQLYITLSANPLAIMPVTGAREDTVLPHTPTVGGSADVSGCPTAHTVRQRQFV